MARRYRVRDNPVGSFFGGLFALGFAVLGLTVMPNEFGFFKLLWVGMALVGAGTSFYNAFSRRGIANEIIDVADHPEDEATAGDDGLRSPMRRTRHESHRPAESASNTPAARLATLKDLLTQQLITPEEYEQRRQEIIKTL